MLHFAEKISFDILITIQATSPLTTADDLTNALEQFNKNNCDSLLTGVPVNRFYWQMDGTPINYNPLTRPRRQDMSPWIMENGAFYITKRTTLTTSKCRLGSNIGIFQMAPETECEIDEPEDWLIIEKMLQKRNRSQNNVNYQELKLLVVDVDGTLTDAGMYYTADGEVMKKFNTKDAMGMSLLREKGFKLAIITKENSPIVKARAKKLKIEHCFIGIENKIECLNKLCNLLEINLSEVVYIGDDLNDLECMKIVGLAACPNNAAKEVRDIAHFISSKDGGHGAVREITEEILINNE